MAKIVINTHETPDGFAITGDIDAEWLISQTPLDLSRFVLLWAEAQNVNGKPFDTEDEEDG